MAPPILPDNEKFDGSNYLEWRETILMACRVRGARGYLEGTIVNPIPAPSNSSPSSESSSPNQPASATATTTSPVTASTPVAQTDTAWTSTSPSAEEWDARDAWCMLAIRQNVKNPIGLGLRTDGTAAEAWASLEKRYNNSNDLARAYAQRELRSLKLEEGGDYQEHIANLLAKHQRANAIGSNVTDADFREIILTSLPSSWDVVVATLHSAATSTDMIVLLDLHWSRINRNAKVKSSGTSAVALKANGRSGGFTRKICSNPSCGRRGHTIEQCYWPGGGKEGQFPAGFGQRGGATGSATTAASTTGTPTANAAVIETAYALASISIPQDAAYEVTDVPDIVEDVSYMEGAIAMNVSDGHGVHRITYADSGANNHYFANKTDFSTYTKFPEVKEGQAATKSSRFVIHGTGSVEKKYLSNNKSTTFTFSNALHTPDFAANLISVSKFDDAGFNIHFGGGKARFIDPDGNEILEVSKRNGMYIFEEVDAPPGDIATPAKSHEKPTTIDQWHRRFCHFGERTIKDMDTKHLVDGLHIVKSEGHGSSLGLCEDCIYGKQTNRPYDEKVTPETDVLERVHLDLWGPARVRSIGGAEYALTMTDGGSSYRAGYFLAEKTGDVVLEAVKTYKAEAERQTGKKLKCLRMDMGREFLTKALEAWCREEGIRIETPAPYAHSGNGVAERTNRTIIEGMRCVRCDAGLPPKFWAELLATVIYVLNLMPSKRHPGKIPAEVWFNKRQDVSHLRAIGSKAYAKIPSELNPSKLDSTSMRYTLIGYYGRDAYKLLGEDGKIYKARNVIFEEGPGHRTLFKQDALHDEPVFMEEAESFDATNTSSTSQHTHVESIDNAAAPADRDQQAPRMVQHPYPIAPRHRNADNMPDRGDRPLGRSNNANRNAPTPAVQPEVPQAEPRRSSRVSRPTQAIIESRESEERVEEAKRLGEDWAEEGGEEANVAYACPGYDMDLDAAEFVEFHLEEFQSDLSSYVALLAASSDEDYIPKSFKDAMKHSDTWYDPMKSEMDVMDRRGVFTKVERPEGKRVIGLKWIYGLKYNAEGEVVRKKARLVAQGFNQIPGVDFDQTYASVARLESMRMCLAIIAHLDLHLWQIDFVAAYLNSTNKFEVYTEQAPGFVASGEEHLVYRANKTVYGMMAGAHDWEQELSTTYNATGYYQSKADPCVRHRVINGKYTLNVTYTDDVVGGSSTVGEKEKAVQELEDAYEVKRVEDGEGKGRFILGMSMSRDDNTGAISLSQRPYFERLLKKHNMWDCNPKSTPLPLGIDLSSEDCAVTEEQKRFMADKPYREVLGSVMWAQVATRPDLSFAVNLLARFQINPGPAHWKALMHVLAYIKGTLDYKITYHRGTTNGLKPYGYVDADYAGDLLDTGRSTGAYVFLMAGGPVSWSSKRQETVATSTTAAEYMATSRACQQAVWMASFMREAGLEQELPTIMYNDNTGSIALTQSAKGHKKAKHIQIRYHYIRERVSEGDVKVVHINSDDNLADILTKPLPKEATEYQCRSLGLCP